MKSTVTNWLFLLLCCIAVMPALVYLTGMVAAGPYEGGGIGGLYQSLYLDAIAGKPGAWVVLAAPLLVVVIWKIMSWISPGKSPASNTD